MPDPPPRDEPAPRGAPPRPDQRVLDFAGPLAERLDLASMGRLRAAYLHGSAVLGGWIPDRSDVDLLVIVTDDVAGPALTAIAGELIGAAARCPGRSLETSVISVAAALAPGPPWPFLVHVNAERDGGSAAVVSGDQQPGDRDLLMHYAVCRAAGWPVTGPPPAQLIGAVPRRLITDYLADELDWGLKHADQAYAVLNACRALVFVSGGVLVSKLAGAHAALDRGLGPRDVIARAIRQQRGEEPAAPAGPAAISFVMAAAATLRAAAEAEID